MNGVYYYRDTSLLFLFCKNSRVEQNWKKTVFNSDMMMEFQNKRRDIFKDSGWMMKMSCLNPPLMRNSDQLPGIDGRRHLRKPF